MSDTEATSDKARFDFGAAAQRQEDTAPVEEANRFSFSAAASPLDERKPTGDKRSARFEFSAPTTGQGRVGASIADGMQVDDEVYRAPALKRSNKSGEDQPELRLVRILSAAPHRCGGRVSGGLKVCLQLADECTYESHRKSKVVFPSNGWGVEAPSSSRAPASAFCKPFLEDKVSESSSVFETIKDETMELSRWVEVFDYITNAHNQGETEDHGTVRRLREVVPNATPKKRSKVDIASPPEVLEFTPESDGTDWLLSWHRQMKVWMRQTTENLQEIDASMFRMQSALGTLDRLELRRPWLEPQQAKLWLWLLVWKMENTDFYKKSRVTYNL
jgi:hypothetical protein